MNKPLSRLAADALIAVLIIVGLPATPASGAPPDPIAIEHEISDAYAKAFVLRTTGRTDVVDAMKTRFHSPAVRGTGPVFYTTIYSSPPKWAGWMANQGGAFLHRVYGVFSDFYAQGAGGCCVTLGSWVGVGGFGNCGLIQAGVNSQSMQAFYELLNFDGSCAYPSTPVFSVNAGDHMWAYITLNAANGKWYVQIQDLTLGRYYANEWTYSPSLLTAEWITEEYGGAVPTGMPGVHFWGARWIDETFNTHNIVDGVYEVVKILNKQPFNGGCIVPTNLSGFNDTFDNQRQNTC